MPANSVEDKGKSIQAKSYAQSESEKANNNNIQSTPYSYNDSSQNLYDRKLKKQSDVEKITNIAGASMVETAYLSRSEIMPFEIANAIVMNERDLTLSKVILPTKRQQSSFSIGIGAYIQLFDYQRVVTNESITPCIFLQYQFANRWSLYGEFSRYKVDRLVMGNPENYNFPVYGSYGSTTFVHAQIKTTNWNLETGVQFDLYKADHIKLRAYSAAILNNRIGEETFIQATDYIVDTTITTYNGQQLLIDEAIIGLNTTFQWSKVGVGIVYGFYIPVNSRTLNWRNRHKIGIRLEYAF